MSKFQPSKEAAEVKRRITEYSQERSKGTPRGATPGKERTVTILTHLQREILSLQCKQPDTNYASVYGAWY